MKDYEPSFYKRYSITMESAGLIGLDYKYKSKWKERNYQLYDAVLTVILLGVASTMMLINRIKSWVKQKN